MHSSIAVADKLLTLAKKDKKDLTPIKLIKLVFLCHAWMLGLYSRHLIKESIEAWKYGPVIRELYDAIKEYRSMPVKYPLSKASDEEFDQIENHIIHQVYEQYGKFTGIELSTLTHEPNGPWDKTWKLHGKNSTISNDLIEDYYKRLANQ